MNSLRHIVLIILALHLCACAAITVTERGDPDFLYRPHYEKSHAFFLWGVVGEHRINTQRICGARPVVQMQSKFEPTDMLYTVLTLGIYMPRTAKVWCERNLAQ